MKRALSMILTLAVLLIGLTACGSQNGGTEDGISGWWVRPENYESEGISLINCFHVDESGRTMTSYNEYGEEVQTLDCEELEGELVIKMPYGDVSFTVAGGQLLGREDGEVEFVKVETPGFAGEELSFDGRWYLAGDPEQTYYEISDREFQRFASQEDSRRVEASGTLTFQNVQKMIGNKQFPDVLELETGESGPRLIPSEDHTIFFEDDGLDTVIYVHESAVEQSMIPAYRMMNDLMAMGLSTYTESGAMVTMAFDENCFYTIVYQTMGQVDLAPVGEPSYGQWELVDAQTLKLTFEDGTEERVMLPEPEGILHVETLGCDFQLAPVF